MDTSIYNIVRNVRSGTVVQIVDGIGSSSPGARTYLGAARVPKQ
jgi:hypothetical protein